VRKRPDGRTATLHPQRQSQTIGARPGPAHRPADEQAGRRALQHYDAELNAAKNQAPIDAVWDLAAAGRQSVAADAASAHDDLYDADGLPN